MAWVYGMLKYRVVETYTEAQVGQSGSSKSLCEECGRQHGGLWFVSCGQQLAPTARLELV